MNKAICRPKNSVHSKENNSIKITNINCTCTFIFCDYCNQSIKPCGSGKLWIRSLIEPMKMSYAPTEGCINKEHSRLVWSVFIVRLVPDQAECVWKQPWCMGNHLQLLVLSVDRSLSPPRVSDYMRRWSVRLILCAERKKQKLNVNSHILSL